MSKKSIDHYVQKQKQNNEKTPQNYTPLKLLFVVYTSFTSLPKKVFFSTEKKMAHAEFENDNYIFKKKINCSP